MSKTVQCELCPTECVLEDYQVGGCRARMNKGGVLYSLVYGKSCAVAVDSSDLMPADVVRQAALYNCRTITYTYTEPTVFYEYRYDTAVIARQAGIKNTMHFCGTTIPGIWS